MAGSLWSPPTAPQANHRVGPRAADQPAEQAAGSECNQRRAADSSSLHLNDANLASGGPLLGGRAPISRQPLKASQQGCRTSLAAAQSGLTAAEHIMTFSKCELYQVNNTSEAAVGK